MCPKGDGGAEEYKSPEGGGGVSDSINTNEKKVVFEHGGRHLDDTNLDVGEVQKSVKRDIPLYPLNL